MTDSARDDHGEYQLRTLENASTEALDHPLIRHLEGATENALVDVPSGGLVFTAGKQFGVEFRIYTPPTVDIVRGDGGAIDAAASKLRRNYR